MRCLSCNRILTPRESSYKYVESQEPIDLCSKCIADLGISYTENTRLVNEQDDEEYIPDFYDEVLGG